MEQEIEQNEEIKKEIQYYINFRTTNELLFKSSKLK